MSHILTEIQRCSLFTGTYGRKRCTAKCLGCYIGESETYDSKYQGNIAQVHELMSLLPNLEEVVIMGNPDPTVDPDFCNEAAKLFQSKGIRTIFFTNGVGGIEMAKKLTKGLDPTLIRGFAFSVHSLDEEKDSKMKGIKVPLDGIFQSMKYLKGLNINVLASFTIWPINMNDDWTEYFNFFESRGVLIGNGFGSVEAANGRIEHVPKEKILEIRKRHSGARLSTILANEEEYQEYLSTFVAEQKFKCTNLKRVDVCFTEKEIKATYSCSLVGTVYPKYFKNIRDYNINEFHENTLETGHCPVHKQALGFEIEGLHPVCRFYKRLSKKPLAKNPPLSF